MRQNGEFCPVLYIALQNISIIRRQEFCVFQRATRWIREAEIKQHPATGVTVPGVASIIPTCVKVVNLVRDGEVKSGVVLRTQQTRAAQSAEKLNKHSFAQFS